MKDSFTSVLVHLTVLSNNSLNPINRHGLKYSAFARSSRTFENVKRSLFQIVSKEKLKQRKRRKLRDIKNKINEGDVADHHLQSFATRVMMVMPHKIGTNFFGLIL